MAELGQEMNGVGCSAFVVPASRMRPCQAGRENEREDGQEVWHVNYVGEWIRLSNVFVIGDELNVIGGVQNSELMRKMDGLKMCTFKDSTGGAVSFVSI